MGMYQLSKPAGFFHACAFFIKQKLKQLHGHSGRLFPTLKTN
jgi:hypothetical protein